MPRGEGVLLEREQELGMIHEGLERARSGDGALLLIEAPAGEGKTALLGEARAAARSAELLLLDAKGSELEQAFAFGVVRQLLEGPVTNESGRADLFEGAAGPAARLFDPDERELTTSDAGFEALHSLYWLTVNLADQAPILVVVDDCQWVDSDSLRFLAYLAQRIEGLPVTMMLASRPPLPEDESTAPLWTQLTARPSAVVLAPRPLSQPAADTLVRQLLSTEATEGFCRSCHAATGGNPLFLRELLRALHAAAVEPSDSAADAVQAVGPAAVSRFVLHRLAGLGTDATEVARAVAVLGDDSDPILAGRVSGLADDSVREAADDLVRADIFVRTERLGFVHPIVRAALYEDLAPGDREKRHAAAASALGEEGASPERVSAHLLLTTPSGDQHHVSTLRSAATNAVLHGAPAAAAAYLRRAIDEGPPEEERARILVELGWYEVATMQFESAEEHLRMALASDASSATRADAASFLGRCAVVSGGHSAEVATDALSSLAEELWATDPERSLELETELLIVITAVPRLRAGLTSRLERFEERARGRADFEAVTKIVRAHEQLSRGEPADPAMEEVQAGLFAGVPASQQTTAGLLALFALVLGEQFELAALLLDAALEGARREGHGARQGIIHALRGVIALQQGSLNDAQVEAETGLLLVQRTHFITPLLLAVAMATQIERGDLEAADELAAAGDGLGIADGHAHLAEFMTARGRLRIAQGRLEAGVADLVWCGERAEAAGVTWPNRWKAFAAPALAELGDEQHAERLAREQVAASRRVGSPGALGLSLRTAAAAVTGDERRTLLEEAVTVLEHSSARLELAHAYADLGAELSRTGRRTEGRDAQRRAIQLADQCGALALAETTTAALQAGPGRRARTELTGPSALTAAEWRVARQAAEGQTNREVAATLFVTEKTVERHLSSAYQKLGIRSRHQLATALGE